MHELFCMLFCFRFWFNCCLLAPPHPPETPILIVPHFMNVWCTSDVGPITECKLLRLSTKSSPFSVLLIWSYCNTCRLSVWRKSTNNGMYTGESFNFFSRSRHSQRVDSFYLWVLSNSSSVLLGNWKIHFN